MLRPVVLPVLLWASSSCALFLPLRPVKAAVPSSLFAPVIASRDYRRRRLVAKALLRKNGNAMSSSSSSSGASSGRRGLHGDSFQEGKNHKATKAVVTNVRGGLVVAPPLARAIQVLSTTITMKRLLHRDRVLGFTPDHITSHITSSHIR